MSESKRSDADGSSDLDPAAPPRDDDRGSSRLQRLKAKIKHLQDEDPNTYPSW